MPLHCPSDPPYRPRVYCFSLYALLTQQTKRIVIWVWHKHCIMCWWRVPNKETSGLVIQPRPLLTLSFYVHCFLTDTKGKLLSYSWEIVSLNPNWHRLWSPFSQRNAIKLQASACMRKRAVDINENEVPSSGLVWSPELVQFVNLLKSGLLFRTTIESRYYVTLYTSLLSQRC